MISVLIVDDSVIVRTVLTSILSNESDIEVIGTAINPNIAIQKISVKRPDVIILDLEMPEMSGLDFMRFMNERGDPIPVVVCSSYVQMGSSYTLEALSLGSAEIIKKPETDIKDFLHEDAVRIINAVRAASQVDPSMLRPLSLKSRQLSSGSSQSGESVEHEQCDKLILIGASTGGVQTISTILESLTVDCAPIMIVQHMPGGFTKSWSERLNQSCQIDVCEAENNQPLRRGMAVIANGDHHLVVERDGTFFTANLRDGPLINRHKPSVDALFRSAVKYADKNVMAIILTGMGGDGAEGMCKLHERGAYTIAQDKETSVIFGMPRVAIERGCASKVLPLDKIAGAIMQFSKTPATLTIS